MDDSNFNQIIPKLYCLHYNECDPKKCTALKLKKFNLLKIINKTNRALNKAIILNPFSQKEISLNDREIIIKYGLIVIDCSWNKVLNLRRINWKKGRKLPPFIAANPTNYGKWEKLSSVEALAAALLIVKFDDYARLLLSKFSWGNEFFKINY
jgi:pre-rRNA-processing protein TSR3